jgi:hypothetical protein
MGKLLTDPAEVTPHVRKVKGGQFKTSADLKAPDAVVRAPFDAKIAHVYHDKTRCGNPGADSNQFTMRQEYVNAKGDRKFTGWAVALAHLVATPGLGRHVKEGDVLGHVSGDVLHAASNKPDRLSELY